MPFLLILLMQLHLFQSGWLHASQSLDTAEPQSHRAVQLEIHLFKEKNILSKLADLRLGVFFEVPEGFMNVAKLTDTVAKIHIEKISSQPNWVTRVSFKQ